MCFHSSGQLCGARIEQVTESIFVRPITRVFLLPPFVAGIINLRGEVVAVLDLAALFGFAPTRVTETTRIVIARVEGRKVGLLVDRLDEVRTVDLARTEPAPVPASSEETALVTGVITLADGVPLVLLDLARLFGCERLRPYQRKA